MKTIRCLKWGVLAIAVLGMGLAGCTGKRMTVSVNNPRAANVENAGLMLAGAAKVDITPGPGMPTGGYSKLGKQGKGFRTRLYARAIYIKPVEGPPVALVQCDLLSGSLLLHHKTAELIAGKTDVAPEGLMIAGTHTHSGPANFFGSTFYNNFAACKPGFEAGFFDFLVERTAAAVIQAYENSRPARIATGTTEVKGATRNRSLPAYHLNGNLGSKPSEQEAVNPLLHMIRVDCQGDDGEFHPIGAFSNFSIHPTAIDTHNQLYNGDVFAYIEREVEWGIQREYDTPFQPVHAAANYTHGDNTPDIPREIDEGFIEAKRVGKMVGRAAFNLFKSLDGRLKDDVPVRFIAKEFDVLEEPAMGQASLCKRPAAGCALTAGATTRYTPVLHKVPWFAPGWPRKVFTGGCQAEKHIVGGFFQRLVLPLDEFPHILFMQIIQVSDTLLAPVPFEICMEAGARMAASMERMGKNAGLEGVSRYVVTSCTNGYWGYVTTPEEYSLQYYEGGHTLYGPQTAAFLAVHLGGMTAALARGESFPPLPESWTFDLKSKRYLPKTAAAEGERQILAQPVFEPAGGNLEACWTLEWQDAPPCSIRFDHPLVQMQVQEADGGWAPLVVEGEPMDDSGYDISVLHLKTSWDNGMGVYRAQWHDPEKASSKTFRFAILPRQDEEVLYSEPFTQPGQDA